MPVKATTHFRPIEEEKIGQQQPHGFFEEVASLLIV